MKFDSLVEQYLEEYEQTNSVSESLGPATRELLFKFLTGQIHPEMAFTLRYTIYLIVSALTGSVLAYGAYNSTFGEILNDIIDSTGDWIRQKFGKNIKPETSEFSLKQALKVIDSNHKDKAKHIANKIIKASKTGNKEEFEQSIEEFKSLLK
jgi:hypothetical protein